MCFLSLTSSCWLLAYFKMYCIELKYKYKYLCLRTIFPNWSSLNFNWNATHNNECALVWVMLCPVVHISSLVCNTRLFTEHYPDSYCVSSINADWYSPEISPRTVVSSANLIMLDKCEGVQRTKESTTSKNSSLQCNGRKEVWGAGEEGGGNLTYWVKKSLMQVWMVGTKPVCFLTKIFGMMVIKTVLKSTKSIL